MPNKSFFGITDGNWQDFALQLAEDWTEVDSVRDYNGDVYKLYRKNMVKDAATNATKIYALELNGLIFAVSMSRVMLQRAIDELKPKEG